MRLKIQRSKWLLTLGSAVLASLIVTVGWLSAVNLRPGAQPLRVVRGVAMPVYSSLDELSAEADTVVLGTVKSVAAVGLDRSASGQSILRPYTIYEFDVTVPLKGEVDDSIYVFMTDPGAFDAPITKLRKGETLLLYLLERTTDDAPTVTITDRVYVTLSWDNAVFDVSTGAVGKVNDDTVVRPRGIREDMFAEGTTFRLSEAKQSIEPDSDEVGPVGSVD